MQLAPLQPADSRLGPPPFGRVVKSTVDLAGPLDAGSREAINTALLEHGLLVIEAQHLCMAMRGVQKQHSTMKTSVMLGSFRDNPPTRSEFLQLLGSP